MPARRRLGGSGAPPIVCVSGPSGAGKTRLLVRLVPALVEMGLHVAVLKHTRHAHSFDGSGKDTARFRRAGAVAAAITGPGGTALFGPPVDGPAELVRLLPPADLVLAEGFRGAPLPRIEVHRRSVSRRFLCAHDPLVFLVVGDEPAPRSVPVLGSSEIARVAEALCLRVGIAVRPRLHVARPVPRVRAGQSKRTLRPVRTAAPGRASMAKTSAGRKSAGSRKGSRSEAGRKGGRATLRARGPEFFSEIGRKGGKSRSRKAAAGRSRAGGPPRSSARPGKRRSSAAGARRGGR